MVVSLHDTWLFGGDCAGHSVRQESAHMGRQLAELFGWSAMAGFGVLSAVVGVVAPAWSIHSTVFSNGLVAMWLLLLVPCRLGGAIAVRLDEQLKDRPRQLMAVPSSWLTGIFRAVLTSTAFLCVAAGMLLMRSTHRPIHLVALVAAAVIGTCAAIDLLAAIVAATEHRRPLVMRAIAWLAAAAMLALSQPGTPGRLGATVVAIALVVGVAEVAIGIQLRPTTPAQPVPAPVPSARPSVSYLNGATLVLPQLRPIRTSFHAAGGRAA
jgi:hypothetical protein